MAYINEAIKNFLTILGDVKFYFLKLEVGTIGKHKIILNLRIRTEFIIIIYRLIVNYIHIYITAHSIMYSYLDIIDIVYF